MGKDRPTDTPKSVDSIISEIAQDALRSRITSPHGPSTAYSNPTAPTLDQIAGMDDAVAWGQSLALDLADYKAKVIPWDAVDSGAVIYGPPGTGKTTFAKSLAVTCRVPLLATSYARWQRVGDGHLGSTLAAMNADFNDSYQRRPSILFIDELDSLPDRKRSADQNHNYMVSVVNGLLEHIDGLSDRPGVTIVGACNRIDNLDPALLRSGRLESKIRIDLPSVAALQRILEFHLAGDRLGEDDMRAIALLCSGMTGADIERLARGGRRAARRASRALSKDDLIDLLDPPNQRLPQHALRRVAVHEAGHAIAALRSKLFLTVTASIVADGGSAGRIEAMPLPALLTDQVLDQLLLIVFAGRAAEEGVLGSVCGGSGGDAGSDLALATRIVRQRLTTLGLAQTSSLVWHGDIDSNDSLVYGGRLARAIDAELQKAYQAALTLVRGEQTHIETIADALIKHRALDYSALLVLLHPRPRRVDAAS